MPSVILPHPVAEEFLQKGNFQTTHCTMSLHPPNGRNAGFHLQSQHVDGGSQAARTRSLQARATDVE